MNDPPLKPTRTLADVIARFKRQLDEQTKPLPKPMTDEAPIPHWQDTEPEEETNP